MRGRFSQQNERRYTRHDILLFYLKASIPPVLLCSSGYHLRSPLLRLPSLVFLSHPSPLLCVHLSHPCKHTETHSRCRFASSCLSICSHRQNSLSLSPYSLLLPVRNTSFPVLLSVSLSLISRSSWHTRCPSAPVSGENRGKRGDS